MPILPCHSFLTVHMSTLNYAWHPQGPPGTGKTSAIMGIVSALLCKQQEGASTLAPAAGMTHGSAPGAGLFAGILGAARAGGNAGVAGDAAHAFKRPGAAKRKAAAGTFPPLQSILSAQRPSMAHTGQQ